MHQIHHKKLLTNTRLGLCYLGIILFVCSSCSSPRSSVPIPSQIAQSSGSKKTVDVITADPLETKFFEGNGMGAEAWRQFIANGRYRLALTKDFQFSDAARRKLLYMFGDSWQSRVFNPYTGGEINHDQFYHDHAYIVVDTARSDSKRFGIVIFNEQAGDYPHKEYWLYKERDLSKTIFAWASSGLHLEEFNERGESTICYVTWDEKQQEYLCDKTPKRRQSSR